MDPLTHTLVGGSLAATRLGTKTRLAAAACVIGANLPDVDVLAFAWGVDSALGFRRGWTHGVLSLAILPLLLAGLLGLWAHFEPTRWLPLRWRSTEAADRPISPAWLVALCYVAVLSHPALDWLNVYGMRWWMPFDGTWYYGDSLFIVDPWLWLVLGTGWLIGRRPSWHLALLIGAPGGLLLMRTFLRAPEFSLAVALVIGALLAILLWRPRHATIGPRAAALGLTISAGYILGMITLHAQTESRVRDELREVGYTPLTALMVGPMPANPLAWDVVFVHDEVLRAGRFRWLGEAGFVVGGLEQPSATGSELWPEIVARGEPSGFLGWTRFPWIEIASPDEGGGVYLMDARYTRARTTGFGGSRIETSTERD